jgi:hypothetical protein
VVRIGVKVHTDQCALGGCFRDGLKLSCKFLYEGDTTHTSPDWFDGDFPDGGILLYLAHIALCSSSEPVELSVVFMLLICLTLILLL